MSHCPGCAKHYGPSPRCPGCGHEDLEAKLAEAQATLAQAREAMIAVRYFYGEDSNQPLSQLDAALAALDAKKPSLVGGDYMETSIAVFAHRCEVLIEEEQRKPLPNNALIAVLCDGVRLTREYTGWAPLKVENEPT